MKMPSPLTKKKDSFILKLSKKLYNISFIQKALAEDTDWIEEIETSDEYYRLQLKTSEIEDVFDWMNYLIYLQKG